MMKINIKRGASQIGGNAVEIIANNGQRIIIDLGQPLNAKKNTADLLPDIRGLRKKTDDLLGIFISHYHQDHFALCKHIDSEIPAYMAETTEKFIKLAKSYLTDKRGIGDLFEFKNVHHISGFQPVKVGPFTITPYPVDHAAYDAFAFLIEADNKRVFYSGDFRAHGRTNKKTLHLFRNPPCNIDVMLMEGSSLDRLNPNERFETEEELTVRMADKFKSVSGLCMVHPSSQNVDRIVTAYRAAKYANRIFVMPPYTGLMMMATGNRNIPQFTRFKDVRKLMPVNAKDIPSHGITATEIAQNPEKYVVVLGNPQQLADAGLLTKNALYVYSMWAGYKEDNAKYMIDTMTQYNVNQCDIHTSGHADIPTLRQMVSAIKPTRLVPIHTFKPDAYTTLFGDLCTVEIHQDNTEFSI